MIKCKISRNFLREKNIVDPFGSHLIINDTFLSDPT